MILLTQGYCNPEGSEKRLLKSDAVSQVSTARKLGILARIATQQAGRSRTWSAAQLAWQSVAGRVGRVLHQLFLEVTGFIFLVLAAIGGFALEREYGKYKAGTVGGGKLLLASAFLLLFAWFGASSFWRARRRRGPGEGRGR